jgi:hypothetical protein
MLDARMSRWRGCPYRVAYSHRTHLCEAIRELAKIVGDEMTAKVHLLMDQRNNKIRYERQEQEAQEVAP